jgi:hypothetical protein
MIKAFLIIVCFTFEILIAIFNQIYIKVLKNQQFIEKILNNHLFPVNDWDIIDKKDLSNLNYQIESLFRPSNEKVSIILNEKYLIFVII